MAQKGVKRHSALLFLLVLLMSVSIIKVSADKCCRHCVRLYGCVGCEGTNYPCLIRCFRECPFICFGDLEKVYAVLSKDQKESAHYEGEVKKNQENYA
ncbi:hypothetical protein ACET3Z_011921 [Daucus carota]